MCTSLEVFKDFSDPKEPTVWEIEELLVGLERRIIEVVGGQEIPLADRFELMRQIADESKCSPSDVALAFGRMDNSLVYDRDREVFYFKAARQTAQAE